MCAAENEFEVQKHILHLEDTIHQLNQVVINQQDQLDELKQVVGKLVQEHLEIKESMDAIPNEKPPHY